MSARLSELGTSQSSSDDNVELVGDDDTGDEYQTMNEKKRVWKQQRKHSITPSKENFLKKVNQNPTPPLKYKLN